MGTKNVEVMVCDACGKTDEYLYRCIGCGIEHCWWCAHSCDEPIPYVTMTIDAKHTIYLCKNCKDNPPEQVKTIHSIVEKLIAFDEHSDRLERERAEERNHIAREIENVENIKCYVNAKKEDEISK